MLLLSGAIMYKAGDVYLANVTVVILNELVREPKQVKS